MWHTEYGDRVLKGAEAVVFADSALDMLQSGLLKTDVFGDIPVFNSLTYPQRIAMLHRAARAVFRPEVPMPEFTAVLDGAVGAIFLNMRWLLAKEIETRPHDTSFRSLVSLACRELTADEDLKWPEDSCNDELKWDFPLEVLHFGILWDREYACDGVLVDLPPETSSLLRAFSGIPERYFQAIADDPTPPQMEILRDELLALCAEVSRTGRAELAAAQQKADRKGKKAGGQKRKTSEKGKKPNKKDKTPGGKKRKPDDKS